MNSNKNIDKEIISYEALMHRVLQNYKVRIDYEDLLQEMRIIVWKVLSDENPETMFIEGAKMKLTSYLYMKMECRLKDLFRTTYKRESNDKEEGKKESVQQRTKKNIAKPRLIEDMSFEQQVHALQSIHDADSIRLKSDIDTFFSILTSFEKKIWIFKIEGWNHYEITKRLKDEDFKISRSTVSRKLKVINDKFIKFIENGEL